jgi:hypothetical protein
VKSKLDKNAQSRQLRTRLPIPKDTALRPAPSEKKPELPGPKDTWTPSTQSDFGNQAKTLQAFRLKMGRNRNGNSQSGRLKTQDPTRVELEKNLQRDVQKFARINSPGLGKLLKQSYPNATPEQRAELLKKMQNGSFPLPKNMQFVDAEQLKGAKGGYSAKNGGTVSLSKDLLSNPAELGRVYAEEAGHHFDEGFKKGDAPGDEGQIFQEGLAKKGALSEKRVKSLRSENDKGTLTKDGKTTKVENSGGAGDWVRDFYDQPKGNHYKFMRSTFDRIASGELKPDGPEVRAMRHIAQKHPEWMLTFARHHAKDENFKSSDLAIDIAAGGLLSKKMKVPAADYPLFVSGFAGGSENSTKIMEQGLKSDDPGAHQAMQDAVIRASAEKPGSVKVDFGMATLYAEKGGPRSQVYLTKAQEFLGEKSTATKDLQTLVNRTRGKNDQSKVRQIEQNQKSLAPDLAILAQADRANFLQQQNMYRYGSRRPQDPYSSQHVRNAQRRLRDNPESKYGVMGQSTIYHIQGHVLEQQLKKQPYSSRPKNAYGPGKVNGDMRTDQIKFMQRRLDEQGEGYRASRSLAKEKNLTPEKFSEKLKSASPDQRDAMLDNITSGLYKDGKPNPANIEAMSQASKHLDAGQIRAFSQAAYATGNGSKATDMILDGDFKQMDPQTANKVVDWVNENGSFEQKLKARQRFPDSPINISPKEWKDNMTPEIAGDIFRDPDNWAVGDAANEEGREGGAIQPHELRRMLKGDNLSPKLRAAAEYLNSNPDAWKKLAGDDNKLSRGELFNGTHRNWSYNAEGGRTDSTHWIDDGVEKQKIKPPSKDGSYAYVERRRNSKSAVTKTEKWTPGGNGRDYLQDRVTKTVENAALPYDVDGVKAAHNIAGTWAPQHLLERVKGRGDLYGTKTTVEHMKRDGSVRSDNWETSTHTEDRYSKYDSSGRLIEEVRKQSTQVGDKQQPPRWVHRTKNGDEWDSQMFIQGSTDTITKTHPRGERNAAGDSRWKMELQDSFLPKTREQIQDYNKYKSSSRRIPVPERRQFDLTATLDKARQADLTQALKQHGFKGLDDNPAVQEFLKAQGGDAFKIAVSGSGSDRDANDNSTIVLEGKDGTRMVLKHDGDKVGGMLELSENRKMVVAGDQGDPTTHELVYDEKTNKISAYQLDDRGIRGELLSDVSNDLSNARNAFNLSQAAIDIGHYPALMATAMKMGGRMARGVRAVTRAERALASAVNFEKVAEKIGNIKGIKGAEMVLGGVMTAVDTMSLIDAIRRGDSEGAFRTAGTLGVDAGATMTASANWLAGGNATAGRLATVARIGKFAGVAGAGVGMFFGGKDLIDGIMAGDSDKMIGGGLGVAGSAGALVGTIWGTSTWFGPVGWGVAALATAGTLAWEGYKHVDHTYIGPPELL